MWLLYGSPYEENHCLGGGGEAFVIKKMAEKEALILFCCCVASLVHPYHIKLTQAVELNCGFPGHHVLFGPE